MDDNEPTNPRWRFDPETGERIPPSPSEQQVPGQGGQYAQPQPQTPPDAFRAPGPDYTQQPQQQYAPPPAQPPQQPGTQQYTQPYQQPQQPNPSQEQYTQPYSAGQPVVPPYASTTEAQVNIEKRRSRAPLIIGLLALLLLVGVGAGAWWFLNQAVNRPAVAAERVLPANTLAYLTVDPAPEGSQKAALDSMGQAFEAQPGFKEAWARFTDQAAELGEAAGMPLTGDAGADATPAAGDYDTLSSYLGNNVTFALLPPSTTDLEQLGNAASGEDADAVGEVMGRNVVALVDLDFNPLNKRGPLVDLKREADRQSGQTEIVEKYRDIDIRKYVTGTQTIFFSLLKDSSTAVAGAKIEPVRAAIDGFTENAGLKENATFKALSGQVPQERVASLYVNLGEIYRQVQLAAPDMEEMQSVQNVDGAMLMTLSAQTDGMQIDIASETNVEGMGVQINPNAKPQGATLSDVPTESLAFLVGTDLKSAIESALESFRKQSESAGGEDVVKQTLDSIESEIGINIENDLLPYLGGDYILSASADSTEGEPSPVVVFQIKLSDDKRQGAEDSLVSTVDRLSNGEAEEVEVGGATFYTLTPEGNALAGVTGDRLLLVVDRDAEATKARVDAVLSNMGKGLGSTAEWKSVATRLPPDSNGVMYVDIEKARGLVEGAISGEEKEEYEATAAPFVRPFKYLLMGTATQANREGNLSRNHTVLFLGIAK